MNTAIRTAIAGLGIVVAGALFLGWREREDRLEVERTLIATARARTGLDAEIERARDRLAATEKDQAELQSALDGVKKSQTGNAQAKAAPSNSATRGRVKGVEVLNADPALRAALVASRRVAVSNSYQPFAKALGLSGAQLERFQEILVDRDLRQMETMDTSRSNDPADRLSMEMNRKQAEDAFRTAQTELLGEAGFEQLQQFERVVPVQAVVQQFAGATAVDGVPLNPQQGELMATILAKASASFQRGGMANHSDVDWPMVEAQARQILSPEQFAIFMTQEPLGGGDSRFGALLGNAQSRANKPDATGTKPPGK